MVWLAFWIYLKLQALAPESNIDPILVENLRRETPTLAVVTVQLHVQAAREAQSVTGLQVEVLLAMALVESRLDPTATSRLEAGRRVTGPIGWAPVGQGPRFCGVLQTRAAQSWLACLVMRDLDVGYLVGARELQRWLRYTRGDLRAALRGHGCGFAGVRGTCRGYDERVLVRAKRLMIRSPRDLPRSARARPRASTNQAL